ncbi:uncharacterized protein TrAFT101_008117 [Trichoderma asperellum]|uniref:uncharacterized protein n=1 Tax=Trichoderma asperellum TaxID=101201 RepID=UPI00332C7605|nr:hypothetical protein TrAFT101_008117 [Trichoderma asperellum]
MVFTKLIIAGTTGYLAGHASRAILASTKPKFDVTILTRVDSGKAVAFIPGARVVPVDYNDHNGLVKTVAGADAILSFIPGPSSKSIDRLLLKAAQEAGVRRIFPSEYTLDILHPAAITVLDSGDHYFAGCSLPFIGAAIIAVLQMDEEKTKNKRISITKVRATMNQIVDIYEELLGTKFQRAQITSQEFLNKRNADLAAGNAFAALLDGIIVGEFNGCGAGDLVDGLAFDGDGLLNIKRKTLKELTTEALKKIGTI